MKQGILIVTWSGGEECFTTLINSIPKDLEYPILIVVNGGKDCEWPTKFADRGLIVLNPEDGYELGALKIALEVTEWEEILLLQDTIEIVNPEIFDIFFKMYSGLSICYDEGFHSYLGKYRRDILDQLEIPTIHNKIEAIDNEYTFNNAYYDKTTLYLLKPDFKDDNFAYDIKNYEMRFGRLNLVLKDEHIIKRKGTWMPEQVVELNKKLGLGWGFTEQF